MAPWPEKAAQVVAASDNRLYARGAAETLTDPGILFRFDGDQWSPWPDSNTRILAIATDDDDKLWIIDRTDNDAERSRLRALDSDDGITEFELELPEAFIPATPSSLSVAVSSSCLLIGAATGEEQADSAIHAYNVATEEWHTFDSHSSLEIEENDGDVSAVQCRGLALSFNEDETMIFYGRHCSRSWYSLPTAALCPGLPREQMVEGIALVGPKPYGAGASVDQRDRARFPDGNSLLVLNADGSSESLSALNGVERIDFVGGYSSRWALIQSIDRDGKASLRRIYTGVRGQAGR